MKSLQSLYGKTLPVNRPIFSRRLKLDYFQKSRPIALFWLKRGFRPFTGILAWWWKNFRLTISPQKTVSYFYAFRRSEPRRQHNKHTRYHRLGAPRMHILLGAFLEKPSILVPCVNSQRTHLRVCCCIFPIIDPSEHDRQSRYCGFRGWAYRSACGRLARLWKQLQALSRLTCSAQLALLATDLRQGLSAVITFPFPVRACFYW